MEELRAAGTLETGEDEGGFGEEFPLYGWRQEITESPIDGLFEVTVTVELIREEERVPLYELKTLLFEMPYSEEREEREREGAPGAGPGGLPYGTGGGVYR